MSESVNAGVVGRKPYRRSMKGWWRRDPFFVRYMIREVTAFIVAAYAIVLLVGVLALARGEAAWNGWLAAMRSPLSVALHGLMLVGMIYHTWSWFEIMPKTLPALRIGGQRVAPATIITAGLVAAVIASLALFGLAWMLRP